MARREVLSMATPERLAPEDPHRRGLWVAVGAIAIFMLIASTAMTVNQFEARHHSRIASWIEAHQTGDDQFIVWDQQLNQHLGFRPDIIVAEDLDDLERLILKNDKAHILVSVHGATALVNTKLDGNWRIDSRLDFDRTDYLLLTHGQEGTRLGEYLLGAN